MSYDAYLFNGRPKGGYLDCIGSKIPTIEEAMKRIEGGAPKIASWWGEAHGQITSRCRIILLYEYKDGKGTWTKTQTRSTVSLQKRGSSKSAKGNVTDAGNPSETAPNSTR